MSHIRRFGSLHEAVDRLTEELAWTEHVLRTHIGEVIKEEWPRHKFQNTDAEYASFVRGLAEQYLDRLWDEVQSRNPKTES